MKTFVITDEFNFSSGIHNFMGGIQFESNKAVNGFMQAGSAVIMSIPLGMIL